MSENYSAESLSEIAGGDQEFMLIVAKTFLEEIPPDLSAMEEAIENNNRELAYQFAHKMKPNLEMFGLNLQKDITAIESWTKTLKNKTSIEDNLSKVILKVGLAIDDLKHDFNI
ncbi:MAG: Hpt domain-containing protein [Flavobacteriaceae bacterium]|nr:Hpt domain-containing protein [Flavobacteriaceae bacterium]